MKQILDYCRCTNKLGHPTSEKCLKGIYNPQVIEYSKRNYGKVLCYDCQLENPKVGESWGTL
jgi:hypothetical protein